jgi:hypothetical protein
MKIYERISKEDGAVSSANEGQVRHGLETSVKDVDLALEQIHGGAEIGNSFFTYRLPLGEFTRQVKLERLRDQVRDMAALDSRNEGELHRMADRIDGLMRIAKFGHHPACGTVFNRACDCNGPATEGRG